MTPMLIQIQRWLMQPKAWRFVGFASTVVGLFCYALSSSFNHLFGEWNLLKISLYSVFSIIICLAMLFAKVWQHSTSLRFKAHLAFLVLAITSVYSFFFDKAVNGNPDAYSLISCAAFAIMSLSLSRQTHCGFEVDLLYFFLGSLIIQLMKIKLLLAIVGAGFSYSLIILRSSLDAPSETEYLGLQDHVVIQVDSQQANNDSAFQVDSPQSNTGSALIIMPQQVNADSTAPIMTLDAPPESHSQQANTDSALIMPQFMACIKALKKKNRKLIRMLCIHVHAYLHEIGPIPMTQIQIYPNLPQLQTDPNLVMDTLQSEIINDLHEIVKLMVAAGFEEECCHVYSNCRSEFLQECMSSFGLQELNTEDVDKMERIQRWIKASNIAFRILFPKERRLCDRIFFGFSPAADLSFMEVCRELTIHLLNFANTLPNHLSVNLRVFETLDDLIPEFESLFSNQYSVSLMNEAIAIRKRLGEAIRDIFMKLENLICLDTAREAVPDGRIHLITSTVMYYLRDLFRARDTLEKIFKEYPADREGTSFSLSVQMASIIELLESNLEANSKSYTDPALGYVFMMNNGSYIERKANFLESNEWVQKYSAKVRQNLEHYQRSSWDKVLDLLKLDNNESVAPNVAAESMKEKLNLFNMHFKEICSVQSTWCVYDKQLREEIRISLEDILVPAYGNFIGRFQNVLGKHADEHIKYGMFDIIAVLNGLLRGRMSYATEITTEGLE